MNLPSRFSPGATAAGADAPSLAARLQVLAPPEVARGVSLVVQEALAREHVLALDYEDRHGRRSRRQVEPVAFVEIASRWYLLAWCRLREEARCFRLDRIRRALDTGARVPP